MGEIFREDDKLHLEHIELVVLVDQIEMTRGIRGAFYIDNIDLGIIRIDLKL